MTGEIRKAVALTTALGALALAPAAEAAIPNVPDGAGGNINCTVQGNGQRHCSGLFTTFDGSPIDLNIGFPPAPAAGPDGDFPLIGVFHGWGGSKSALTSGGMQEWLTRGYAVLTISDRGWGGSCGGLDPKRLTPQCLNGYNHLMDTRYEVRDVQEILEALADRDANGAENGEGLIHPRRIGATGGSYGGGMSMALGALRDRKMLGGGEGLPLLPEDGRLVPWVSDGGKQMEIAAAQPDIPWTDLAYSLMPNGHTLDYVADSPYLQRGRVGILKQSFVAGLYAVGAATSNYAAPGTDPSADLHTWYALVNAGDPYDVPIVTEGIVEEITRHHSSYYIDDSTPPAPMLISNGWTDDLFPADEAIRFYNRTRTNHPDTPISLIFNDHGHQRGQNRGPDSTFRTLQRRAWFEHYVKGTGPEPFQGVQTLTQTCGAPSGGASGPFTDANNDTPFRAPTWAEIAPGEVRAASDAEQLIAPAAGNPEIGASFDPIAGGGACATTSAADQEGAATYRLPPAPEGGYTLMGSPTVVADILSPGPTSQIAARLLSVAPNGQQTLIARGLYRPEINLGVDPTRQVFQLHPNGWHFAEGHVAKLELLPHDAPYGRVSNGQLPVTVSNLDLRLPVVEEPDGETITEPAPKVLPEGYELARDFIPPPLPAPTCEDVGASTPFGASVEVTLDCAGEGDLVHSILDDPANGSISDLDPAAGTLTYTPDPGFHGQDSFTYSASNGEPSDPARVDLTVDPPAADPPAADPLPRRPGAAAGNARLARGGPLAAGLANAWAPIRCFGRGHCRSVLELRTAPRRGQARGARVRGGILLGRRAFRLGAGRQRAIPVPLNRRGRMLLRRRGGVRAVVRIRTAGSRTRVARRGVVMRHVLRRRARR